MNPFDVQNIPLKKYPTRFYARTLLYWAGVFTIGPFASIGCYEGLSGKAGDASITITIIGLILAILVIAWVFQIFARRQPLLQFYREGIMIRLIGTRMPEYFVGIGMIIAVFIIYWQFITLKLFQIRTIHWRWENLEPMLPKKGTLWIAGESGKDVPLGYATYSSTYETDPFVKYLDDVIEAVQFYYHNPDQRETLPSWQDEETVFGSD
jgi:hypothetical protein